MHIPVVLYGLSNLESEQYKSLQDCIDRQEKKYGYAELVEVWWTDPGAMYDYGEYSSGPPRSLMARILVNKVPTRWKWKSNGRGKYTWIRVH